MRRWRRLIAALLGLSALVFFIWFVGRSPIETHAPPADLPPLPEASSADDELLESHPPRMPEEAAILLLRGGQRALAGAAAFSSAGVPFCVTRSLPEALQRRMVLIPSGDRSIRPSLPELESLRAFVQAGGVLIVQAPPDAMPSLTGIGSDSPRRTRRELAFRTPSDPGFAYLDEPEERTLPLAGKKTREGPWTHGLRPESGSRSQVLADFPDTREPAVLRRSLGSGFVYTLGFDLKDMVLRPRAQRHFDAKRSPSNGFEPGADVWPLILRAWYEHYSPFWIRLRALPAEAKGLVLLSHNMGWGSSPDTARAFLDIERKRGIRATWFIQTKRVKDVLPGSLFEPPLTDFLQELNAAGHELASHSVAHGPGLRLLPFGGGERAEDYLPAVDRYGRTVGGTLLGEAGVSKQLIEASTGAAGTPPLPAVLGFRSGFLGYADILDEALAAAGYSYDSSFPANAAMTHFPFFLPRRRGMDLESPVLALPMTFEDENEPESPLRLAELLKLLAKVSANEGTFVWLIHPNPGGEKRGALAQTLGHLPDGTAVWTLGKAAEFWKSRSATRFHFVRKGPKSVVLTVEAPSGSRGLSFEVSEPVKSCASDEAAVRCSGRLVVLERKFNPYTEIRLTLR